MRHIQKPDEEEYAPYVRRYISLIPDDGRVLEHLQESLNTILRVLGTQSEAKLLFRYAENKWTIKEIVQHLSDDERIYTYRALRFARGDATELPGFEQDKFARYSEANRRPLQDLFTE